MLDNDTQGAAALTIGDSIMKREPSHEAELATGGETSAATNNNESENFVNEPADEAVSNDEGNNDSDFASGTAKARKLGESRRKLASTLLESATESEVAKNNFKKLIEEDKELGKYFRKHFPKQLQGVLESSPGGASIDKESMKQIARAELLVEELKEQKEADFVKLASKAKLNSSEANDVKSLAERLEGTLVNGKELEWDDAVKRAVGIIRPDKAKIVFTALPSGKGAESAVSKSQAENERLADLAPGLTRVKKDREQYIKNLEMVDRGYDPKARKFVMPS